MKKFKSILLAAILMTFSAGAFAQEISFNMEILTEKSKEPIIMKVMAKGSKMAMIPQNMGEGKMSFIIDNAAGKQYMLMDMNGQKMAMMMNAQPDNAAGDKSKEPKLTVTNETKTIDGYKCRKVIAETDEGISDMWLSEEVGYSYTDLYKMMNSNKGGGSTIPEMKNIKGFPLEMISKDKKKGETVTMRIRNIAKGNVSDSAFSMDGYKMMDMGNMKN